jgi:5S rRNA maturation endonuclease (ribonuclease M5)
MSDTPLNKVLGIVSSHNLHLTESKGNGWTACCPAHDDKNPSLSITEATDGKVLLHCFAGCSSENVVSALGITMSDLFPKGNVDTTYVKPVENDGFVDSSGKGQQFESMTGAIKSWEKLLGKCSKDWLYHDEEGNPVAATLRWDLPDGGKDIRPVSLHDNQWTTKGMLEPRTLYNLPKVIGSDVVFICEGEKAADAVNFIGLTATTSVNGAQSPGKTDWSPLAGKKVVILPDNDEPGKKYAAEVAQILSRLMPQPSVKVADLTQDWPDLPEKGDAHDWVEHYDAVESETLKERLESLADAEVVLEPERTELSHSEFQAFPVEVLPNPVREFVDSTAKSIGCDPSCIVLPLLTLLGSAIGNTRRLRLKPGWDVPPILWTLLVGKSGSSKTPAWSKVMELLVPFEKKADKQYRRALEGYQNQLDLHRRDKKKLNNSQSTDSEDTASQSKPVRPKPRRYSVTDTTVEALAMLLHENDRGLLLARDELAGWISSFDKYSKGGSSSDASSYLSMFNALPLQVDRKTGELQSIYVPHAAVCISGGIQPTVLQRVVGTAHRENGLLARFLFTFPPQNKKRWTDVGVDLGKIKAVQDVLEKLYDLPFGTDDVGDAVPKIVQLSLDAKKAFIDYFDEHADEQLGLDDDLSAAWSKLEEYPARLALIIHLSRWAANEAVNVDVDEVDESSMQAGITLAKWFCEETRRVYDLIDQSEAEEQQAKLVDWIRNNGSSVTSRDVQRGIRSIKKNEDAENALEALVKNGIGYWKDLPPGTRGGRPTRNFVLHPV